MPTDLELLQTSRTQILTLITEITADPKPSYSIDGQSVSWGEYLGQLLASLRSLNEQLAALQGPVVLETTGEV